ncbi:MAG: 23S rRNA (adenine(2030)-N(6))-methyltransferase RlmJ [Janthinobacterium lividum]
MNYRHAFHAGNFADCMKHALLLSILGQITRKAKPVFVLDTHAGRGGYDLMAEGQRTGEWKDGIARLIPPPPPLADYVGLAERLGLYPGSPMLIRARLRPGDALACCELHPEDAAALRRRFRADPAVSVHQRDGYEAIGALLPPPQRRGLVLIDPPFEQADEFRRVTEALVMGGQRFDNGVYAAWYPIKHRSPVTAFHHAVQASGLRDVIACELWLREPTDPARLNGCGLLVRNPPYGFEAEAVPLLEALRARMGEAGSGTAVLRLADE